MEGSEAQLALRDVEGLEIVRKEYQIILLQLQICPLLIVL